MILQLLFEGVLSSDACVAKDLARQGMSNPGITAYKLTILCRL